MSLEGGDSIRKSIYQQISNYLSNTLADPNANISLTLIGHSAGSVVAFDLMTYLFASEEISIGSYEEQAASLRKQLVETTKKWKQNGKHFGRTKKCAVLSDSLSVAENFIRLKSIKSEGRLTLRRLITMGSPIAMMAFRNDDIVRSLAYGERIPLASIGLPSGSECLDAPYWINIWNKYDPISFPVEPMFEQGLSVKDFHLRIGWNPLTTHVNYWNSKNVHRLLAKLW